MTLLPFALHSWLLRIQTPGCSTSLSHCLSLCPSHSHSHCPPLQHLSTFTCCLQGVLVYGVLFEATQGVIDQAVVEGLGNATETGPALPGFIADAKVSTRGGATEHVAGWICAPGSPWPRPGGPPRRRGVERGGERGGVGVRA